MPSAYVVRRGGRYGVKTYIGREGRRRLYRWEGTFDTLTEAKAHVARMASTPGRGPNVGPSGDAKTRLSAMLEDWLRGRVARGELRPRTADRYAELARVHIVPELGHLPYARVEAKHVRAMVETRLAAGASPRTVRHALMLLHKAFADAAVEDAALWNPCEHVRPPRVQPFEPKVWTEEETARFLDAARGSRYGVLFLVAATTGLRLGEVLGLRWQDLDLEAGALHVRQSVSRPRGGGFLLLPPKSAMSRRGLPLAPEVAAELQALRRRRPALPQALVFAQASGKPLRPKTVRGEFYRLVRSARLPRVRLHDLRHAYGTMLDRAGVPLKEIQARMGHASAAFTLQTYIHSLRGESGSARAVSAMLAKRRGAK